MAGVRLAEVAPVVPDDVPVGGQVRMLGHEVDQQGLAKVLGADLLAGRLKDRAARRIVNLARVGLADAARRLLVGLDHHRIGGLLLRHWPVGLGHPLAPPDQRLRVAYLGRFCLVHLSVTAATISMSLAATASGKETRALPRSRKLSLGEVR